MCLESKELCFLTLLNPFISIPLLLDHFFILLICFVQWLVGFRYVDVEAWLFSTFLGHFIIVQSDNLKFYFLKACLPDLPDGYMLSVPRLNLLSSPEVRQPGKAPNYSVNWALGYDNPEIIDAMKGKDQVNSLFIFCLKMSPKYPIISSN